MAKIFIPIVDQPYEAFRRELADKFAIIEGKIDIDNAPLSELTTRLEQLEKVSFVTFIENDGRIEVVNYYKYIVNKIKKRIADIKAAENAFKTAKENYHNAVARFLADNTDIELNPNLVGNKTFRQLNEDINAWMGGSENFISNDIVNLKALKTQGTELLAFISFALTGVNGITSTNNVKGINAILTDPTWLYNEEIKLDHDALSKREQELYNLYTKVSNRINVISSYINIDEALNAAIREHNEKLETKVITPFNDIIEKLKELKILSEDGSVEDVLNTNTVEGIDKESKIVSQYSHFNVNLTVDKVADVNEVFNVVNTLNGTKTDSTLEIPELYHDNQKFADGIATNAGKVHDIYEKINMIMPALLLAKKTLNNRATLVNLITEIKTNVRYNLDKIKTDTLKMTPAEVVDPSRANAPNLDISGINDIGTDLVTALTFDTKDKEVKDLVFRLTVINAYITGVVNSANAPYSKARMDRLDYRGSLEETNFKNEILLVMDALNMLLQNILLLSDHDYQAKSVKYWQDAYNDIYNTFKNEKDAAILKINVLKQLVEVTTLPPLGFIDGSLNLEKFKEGEDKLDVQISALELRGLKPNDDPLLPVNDYEQFKHKLTANDGVWQQHPKFIEIIKEYENHYVDLLQRKNKYKELVDNNKVMYNEALNKYVKAISDALFNIERCNPKYGSETPYHDYPKINAVLSNIQTQKNYIKDHIPKIIPEEYANDPKRAFTNERDKVVAALNKFDDWYNEGVKHKALLDILYGTGTNANENLYAIYKAVNEYFYTETESINFMTGKVWSYDPTKSYIENKVLVVPNEATHLQASLDSANNFILKLEQFKKKLIEYREALVGGVINTRLMESEYYVTEKTKLETLIAEIGDKKYIGETNKPILRLLQDQLEDITTKVGAAKAAYDAYNKKIDSIVSKMIDNRLVTSTSLFINDEYTRFNTVEQFDTMIVNIQKYIGTDDLTGLKNSSIVYDSENFGYAKYKTIKTDHSFANVNATRIKALTTLEKLLVMVMEAKADFEAKPAEDKNMAGIIELLKGYKTALEGFSTNHGFIPYAKNTAILGITNMTTKMESLRLYTNKIGKFVQENISVPYSIVTSSENNYLNHTNATVKDLAIAIKKLCNTLYDNEANQGDLYNIYLTYQAEINKLSSSTSTMTNKDNLLAKNELLKRLNTANREGRQQVSDTSVAELYRRNDVYNKQILKPNGYPNTYIELIDREITDINSDLNSLSSYSREILEDEQIVAAVNELNRRKAALEKAKAILESRGNLSDINKEITDFVDRLKQIESLLSTGQESTNRLINKQVVDGKLLLSLITEVNKYKAYKNELAKLSDAYTTISGKISALPDNNALDTKAYTNKLTLEKAHRGFSEVVKKVNDTHAALLEKINAVISNTEINDTRIRIGKIYGDDHLADIDLSKLGLNDTPAPAPTPGSTSDTTTPVTPERHDNSPKPNTAEGTTDSTPSTENSQPQPGRTEEHPANSEGTTESPSTGNLGTGEGATTGDNTSHPSEGAGHTEGTPSGEPSTEQPHVDPAVPAPVTRNLTGITRSNFAPHQFTDEAMVRDFKQTHPDAEVEIVPGDKLVSEEKYADLFDTATGNPKTDKILCVYDSNKDGDITTADSFVVLKGGNN